MQGEGSQNLVIWKERKKVEQDPWRIIHTIKDKLEIICLSPKRNDKKTCLLQLIYNSENISLKSITTNLYHMYFWGPNLYYLYDSEALQAGISHKSRF